MMKPGIVYAALVAGAVALPAFAAEMPTAPYAGQQARAIKALSDEDIAGLRRGEGMGMAKAAELNGYPGPAHVLALARKLGLNGDQALQVAAIYDRMSAAAKRFGGEVISREELLDRLFAERKITPERLAIETAAIAAVHGRLRAAHLAAHLETRALLNPRQIALYHKLRGYGGQ